MKFHNKAPHRPDKSIIQGVSEVPLVRVIYAAMKHKKCYVRVYLCGS